MSTTTTAVFHGDAMRQAFVKAGIRKPRVRRAQWPRAKGCTRREAGIKNLHFALEVR